MVQSIVANNTTTEAYTSTKANKTDSSTSFEDILKKESSSYIGQDNLQAGEKPESLVDKLNKMTSEVSICSKCCSIYRGAKITICLKCGTDMSLKDKKGGEGTESIDASQDSKSSGMKDTNSEITNNSISTQTN